MRRREANALTCCFAQRTASQRNPVRLRTCAVTSLRFMIAAYSELQYVPDWPKGTYPEGACITASSM
jgi:hypothetical protein